MTSEPTRSTHDDESAIYPLPNDTPEQARLHEQARHVDTITNHQFFQSPIWEGTGKKLLDIGCGTGYLTDRLAFEFPQAHVFGLDLSPIPHREGRPSNEHFVIGNYLNQEPTAWEAQEGGLRISQDNEVFDLLLSRFLIGGIDDWPAFFNRQFRMLKSGGWSEVQEFDPLIYNKDGTTTTEQEQWHIRGAEAAATTGMDYRCAQQARSRMIDSGFVDVTVREYPLPLGGEGLTDVKWREAGEFFARTFPEIREFLYRKYVDESEEEKEKHIGELREAMAPAPGRHCKLVRTFGRKP